MADNDDQLSFANFADYPKSVATVQAERFGNGSEWTPRDALIDMLREIDSGKLAVTELIICYNYSQGSDKLFAYSNASASKIHGMVGMLEIIKHQIIGND